MARVGLFVPDLLFGSNVLGALQAAGHDVALISDPGDVDSREVDILVVDLTSDARARIDRVRIASLDALPKLAFYSHVETDVRELAERNGFALVVPRSRMAREGVALIERLSG